MENIKTTRKIKWTIKNVSEETLNQRSSANRIQSSWFQIYFDEKFYEWQLWSYTRDGFLGIFLIFDKNYRKEGTITFKARVAEDKPFSFTLLPETILELPGSGWHQFIPMRDLMNPEKNYVDKNKSLIINLELTLEKTAKPLETVPVPASVRDESYAEFLNDDDWSDASFTCNDNVKVKVHRIVLIKKSAKFKKIFNGMKQYNQRNRKLTNIDSITLNQVLKFAYTGSADLEDAQMIKKIYQASVAYDLPELQLQCADALNNLMSSETVLDIFEVSSDLKLEELTGKCLSNIMRLFHQLKTTQKWMNLSMPLKEKVYNGFADNYSDIDLDTTI